MQASTKINTLRPVALLVLFVSSYIPLFFLVIFRQVTNNWNYLNWGGWSKHAIFVCCEKFGLSILLGIISAVGLLGLVFTFKRLQRNFPNGDNVIVKSIQNRNSESIGYIATYIIPFLFQNFSNLYDAAAFIFLMCIIYRIYIHSSMIAINPLLCCKYSIYDISYEAFGCERTGLLITDEKQLQENDIIKIYEIGYKLFFSKEENKK